MSVSHTNVNICMQQSVYIDLYFLVNFSMDLLCILITAALMHRKITRIRAILAAVAGGGYAIVALLLNAGGLLGFLGDAVIALALCVIAFHTRRCAFRKTAVCVPIFLLTSMMMGGIMTALYSLLNRLELPFETLQGDGLSVWIFALLSAVAGFATLRGGAFMGLSRKTKSVTVCATLFGKDITLCAMVDSGNLLRDPISGKSVIVADLERLSPCLPSSLLRSLEKNTPTEWLTTHQNATAARLIPAQTAAGSSMLLALVPERLTLTVNGDTYEASYLIAPAPLSSGAQGFDAVIAMD